MPLGALPSTFRLPELNDGSGLQETLKKKNGKYHKNCRCTYDGQKLERTRNRLHPSTVDDKNSSVCGRSTRSNLGCSIDIKNVCLFCNASEGATKKKLTQAPTIEVGRNIMSHAIVLNDTQLIAKLSTDDLVALEAKYHRSCNVKFLTRSRSCVRNQDGVAVDQNRLAYGVVVSELVQYMQDMFTYSETAPAFRLSDITKLLDARLNRLGIPSTEHPIN